MIIKKCVSVISSQCQKPCGALSYNADLHQNLQTQNTHHHIFNTIVKKRLGPDFAFAKDFEEFFNPTYLELKYSFTPNCADSRPPGILWSLQYRSIQYQILQILLVTKHQLHSFINRPKTEDTTTTSGSGVVLDQSQGSGQPQELPWRQNLVLFY